MTEKIRKKGKNNGNSSQNVIYSCLPNVDQLQCCNFCKNLNHYLPSYHIISFINYTLTIYDFVKTPTQHNTTVGFDMKMALQTPPPTTHHTNISGTSRRARELKFGTDTH